MKWPYPVKYRVETDVKTDVLIIGGGIAGCHAAISAAKKGVKVAVVDKASVQRSGSGGAGVDHWGGALTNPCSQITPEQAMQPQPGAHSPFHGKYAMGHLHYVASKESWDALLDLEQMGMKIRDTDDDFTGAPFRDEKTKLLSAYDYKSWEVLRVWGADVKLFLYNELKRLGVELYEHIMATSLLNEGGKQGGRIIGATGVNVRTGEFYVFRAKATILATAQPLRIWVFNTELVGSNAEHDDPNLAGDGDAMGWLAGAELTKMEHSTESAGPFRYPSYGTGNCGNTWYPCTMVDANGKEIPWVDGQGNILKTYEERIKHGGQGPQAAHIIDDLPERILKGEYKQPFFADLPSMPEYERKAIFGLMVGNEGKTRIIYNMYTQAGFDPDKDMLQQNVLPPHLTIGVPPWDMKTSSPQWRATAFMAGGGLLVDWDMRTTLEGLYAAGAQTAGGGGHPPSSATGRYAGRKAAAYSKEAEEPVVDRKQVDDEKARVYAPVGRKGDIGWKELHAGICRIMQDYCGKYKNKEVLETGLWWLNSIRESESARVYVRNPHELWRFLETMTRLTVCEIIMQASLARKASSAFLDFWRVDYTDIDPPEWDKFVTIKLEDNKVKTGELPLDFWLRPPYTPDYEENYRQHSGL